MNKSGSLHEITNEKVKIIQQYHRFKDLLFEIADSADIDISKLEELERHLVVNILLRNFLGTEKYNDYIKHLKLSSNQWN